jgi:5-carboxymethyl-2-hydroxymuconate isomerase
MTEVEVIAILTGVFTVLVTIIQGMALFILGDIRSRIARVETHIMHEETK